jgi:hypothetical protein
MKPSGHLTPRVLGVAHIVVAIVLLPTATLLSLLSIVVVLPGLFWLIVLGVRLWRPGAGLRTALRVTHLVMAPLGGLLIVYGIFCLRAPQRSAEGGGGLLGAFGLVPLVWGLLAAGLSLASLALSFSRVFAEGKE